MAKKASKENIHAGHRQRMKENFLENGLSGLAPHEVIELLLFFGIPMKDTNEIAHHLINAYGNIPAIFNAHYEDLLKIKGMTINAAVLLTMMPELFSIYVNSTELSAPLDNIKDVTRYFSALYFGVKNEELKLCCIDNDMRVTYCKTITEGSIDHVKIDMRKLVETIFRANTQCAIVAHNHPNASPVPSDADIDATRKIKNTLDLLNIQLLDHVIVGKKNTVISMKDNGYFELL